MLCNPVEVYVLTHGLLAVLVCKDYAVVPLLVGYAEDKELLSKLRDRYAVPFGFRDDGVEGQLLAVLTASEREGTEGCYTAQPPLDRGIQTERLRRAGPQTLALHWPLASELASPWQLRC